MHRVESACKKLHSINRENNRDHSVMSTGVRRCALVEECVCLT